MAVDDDAHVAAAAGLLAGERGHDAGEEDVAVGAGSRLREAALTCVVEHHRLARERDVRLRLVARTEAKLSGRIGPVASREARLVRVERRGLADVADLVASTAGVLQRGELAERGLDASVRRRVVAPERVEEHELGGPDGSRPGDVDEGVTVPAVILVVDAHVEAVGPRGRVGGDVPGDHAIALGDLEGVDAVPPQRLVHHARALGSLDELVAIGPLAELHADGDLVEDPWVGVAVARVRLGLVVGSGVDHVEREVALVVTFGQQPARPDASVRRACVAGPAVGPQGATVRAAVFAEARAPARDASQGAARRDQEPSAAQGAA